MKSDIEVIAYQEFLYSGSIRESIRNYDFVLDGTDNFAAKFLINDACVMEKIPFSHAGIIRFKGQLMTVIPGEFSCGRCVFKNPPPETCSPENFLQKLTEHTEKEPVLIDAKGLKCSGPIVKVADYLRDKPEGTAIHVEAAEDGSASRQ